MLSLAHHYDELVTSAAGSYRARVYGMQQADGMWAGYIVFFAPGGWRAISTDRQTTQSTLAALSYWASGLTRLYLHGALDRALALRPEVQLARELEQLEIAGAAAERRAATLESATEAARKETRLAEQMRERAEERFLKTLADAAEMEARAHEDAAATAHETAATADQALRSRSKRSTGTGASTNSRSRKKK